MRGKVFGSLSMTSYSSYSIVFSLPGRNSLGSLSYSSSEASEVKCSFNLLATSLNGGFSSNFLTVTMLQAFPLKAAIRRVPHTLSGYWLAVAACRNRSRYQTEAIQVLLASCLIQIRTHSFLFS